MSAVIGRDEVSVSWQADGPSHLYPTPAAELADAATDTVSAEAAWASAPGKAAAEAAPQPDQQQRSAPPKGSADLLPQDLKPWLQQSAPDAGSGIADATPLAAEPPSLWQAEAGAVPTQAAASIFVDPTPLDNSSEAESFSAFFYSDESQDEKSPQSSGKK